MGNKTFENNEEKLDFIIDYLNLSAKEIEKKFGLSSGSVSKLRKYSYDKLRPMHYYAFESAYNIPIQIFTDETIKNSTQIINLLKQKREDEKSIFENSIDLKGIIGTWYAYVYPSSSFEPTYSIKTTIHADYTVTDKNNNYGQLFIGELQTVLIKKAVNSRNFISIVFDNSDVGYELFHFSMLSKTNHLKKEMCNFGFFSRKEITLEVAESILREKKDVQLQIDSAFKERVVEYAGMI